MPLPKPLSSPLSSPLFRSLSSPDGALKDSDDCPPEEVRLCEDLRQHGAHLVANQGCIVRGCVGEREPGRGENGLGGRESARERDECLRAKAGRRGGRVLAPLPLPPWPRARPCRRRPSPSAPRRGGRRPRGGAAASPGEGGSAVGERRRGKREVGRLGRREGRRGRKRRRSETIVGGRDRPS